MSLSLTQPEILRRVNGMFIIDPEAAKIVYESGIPFVALGLDVATYFDVNFTDDDIKLLEESDRKEAKFLRQAIRFNGNRGFDAYCTVIDCISCGIYD